MTHQRDSCAVLSQCAGTQTYISIRDYLERNLGISPSMDQCLAFCAVLLFLCLCVIFVLTWLLCRSPRKRRRVLLRKMTRTESEGSPANNKEECEVTRRKKLLLMGKDNKVHPSRTRRGAEESCDIRKIEPCHTVAASRKQQSALKHQIFQIPDIDIRTKNRNQQRISKAIATSPFTTSFNKRDKEPQISGCKQPEETRYYTTMFDQTRYYTTMPFQVSNTNVEQNPPYEAWIENDTEVQDRSCRAKVNNWDFVRMSDRHVTGASDVTSMRSDSADRDGTGPASRAPSYMNVPIRQSIVQDVANMERAILARRGCARPASHSQIYLNIPKQSAITDADSQASTGSRNMTAYKF